MKYYQQKQPNDMNKPKKKHNRKSGNYYHHQTHYDVPPRFQQQYFNKENFFRMTNDFNMPWVIEFLFKLKLIFISNFSFRILININNHSRIIKHILMFYQ